MSSQSDRGSDLAGLKASLREFYEDYANAIDDDELERWPEFFTERSKYVIQSAENYTLGLPIGVIYCDSQGMLRDRVSAIRKTVMFEPRILRHFLSGLRIRTVDAETVRATIGFLVCESIPNEEPQIFAVGRYEDVLRRATASFLIEERICVCDNVRIRTSLIYPI
jgi:anthranilate 1,2-dioxygenase small subunit